LYYPYSVASRLLDFSDEVYEALAPFRQPDFSSNPFKHFLLKEFGLGLRFSLAREYREILQEVEGALDLISEKVNLSNRLVEMVVGNALEEISETRVS
jgi:hypothetical protein